MPDASKINEYYLNVKAIVPIFLYVYLDCVVPSTQMTNKLSYFS